jgi:hypothetical protein
MLERIRKELNAIASVNLGNLTSPEVIAKSQELDIEINKAMYKRLEQLKNTNLRGN